MRRGCRRSGPIGEAAAFSFYGNKNMTTAEGGAIIARSRALRDTIRRARSHGMTSDTRQRLRQPRPDYDVTILGFNYRMDELRAALGLAQLKRLPEWNDIRRRLSMSYRQLIAEQCPSVMVPFEASVAIGTSSDAGCASDGDRTASHHRSAAQARNSDHYSLPPVHRLTFYNDLYPDIALPQNRRIFPAGAHAAASSWNDHSGSSNWS